MLRTPKEDTRIALRPNLLIGTALILVALLAFSGSLAEMVRRWISQDEYSHAFFIPLITLWLLWERRNVALANVGRPTWIGPVLIVLSIVMNLVGEVAALFVLSQLGFIVALFGIVLSAGGISLLRVTFVPLVFLAFAIPLPYFIDSVLSWNFS